MTHVQQVYLETGVRLGKLRKVEARGVRLNAEARTVRIPRSPGPTPP